VIHFARAGLYRNLKMETADFMVSTVTSMYTVAPGGGPELVGKQLTGIWVDRRTRGMIGRDTIKVWKSQYADWRELHE
jgi:hypothetical protein